MKERVWSFSRLSTFEQCEFSFYQQYIEEECGENNAWGILGGYTHEVIEKILLGEIAAESGSEYFMKNLPEFNFDTMKPDYGDKWVSDTKSFFDTFKGVNDNVVAVEKDFQIDIDGYKLRGFIDLITESEEGLLKEVDFKTSKKFSKPDLIKKQRQLYLYGAAMKELYGRHPNKMYFYFLRDKAAIEVEWSDKDYQESIGWMKRIVDKINDKVDRGEPFIQNEQYFFCKSICQTSSCPFNRNYNKQL